MGNQSVSGAPLIEVTERARAALVEVLAQKGKNTIRLFVDGFG